MGAAPDSSSSRFDDPAWSLHQLGFDYFLMIQSGYVLSSSICIQKIQCAEGICSGDLFL
jgi:hypothetical protein